MKWIVHAKKMDPEFQNRSSPRWLLKWLKLGDRHTSNMISSAPSPTFFFLSFNGECVLPYDPRCVPEDGGRKTLCDTHQAGPIHLHNLVVHLDPNTHNHKIEDIVLTLEGEKTKVIVLTWIEAARSSPLNLLKMTASENKWSKITQLMRVRETSAWPIARIIFQDWKTPKLWRWIPETALINRPYLFHFNMFLDRTPS